MLGKTYVNDLGREFCSSLRKSLNTYSLIRILVDKQSFADVIQIKCY